MNKEQVLAVLEGAGRRLMRNCDICADPIACAECDSAKPVYEVRAAIVALYEDAERLLDALTGLADVARESVELSDWPELQRQLRYANDAIGARSAQ